jgi:hypothetical protein
MPGYLKRFSITFYTRCMMFDRAEALGIRPENPRVYLPVDGTTALIVLISFTIAFLALGVWIFSRTQYRDTV